MGMVACVYAEEEEGLPEYRNHMHGGGGRCTICRNTHQWRSGLVDGDHVSIGWSMETTYQSQMLSVTRDHRAWTQLCICSATFCCSTTSHHLGERVYRTAPFINSHSAFWSP
jgi:hypothetical protein